MNRKELMKELNYLLDSNYNWSRLSLLDLTRLVAEVRKVHIIYAENKK
jgi:hypothetical protein